MDGKHERKQYQKDYERGRRHPCPNCGTGIARRSKHCRPCGQKQRIEKITGEQNYAWKGGRSVSKGYVYLLVTPEKRKGHRYRAEHIVVWEEAHRKPLPKGWVVHHINGIKDDNRPENLVAVSRSEHNHEHGEQRIRELEAENALLREQLDAA